jgi:hypothetical protein
MLATVLFRFIYLETKMHKTIILPIVLHGYAISSLTVREEQAQRVFENRVLRRIFGPKWEEVARGCRRQLNEKLHN